ncbi:hypothetical protein PUN28_014389 [Cardiocondyla obscurior]|uniref:Uncharacterized protein n=1 Tax=Cardiocondyla obscurior TaxID=286306 RepID=A0AAW2F220_9HYME
MHFSDATIRHVEKPGKALSCERRRVSRSYGASGFLKHWNSCDIPISLYNRYVVHVARLRRRNEFGKKQRREKSHDGVRRNPCCSPISGYRRKSHITADWS